MKNELNPIASSINNSSINSPAKNFDLPLSQAELPSLNEEQKEFINKNRRWKTKEAEKINKRRRLYRSEGSPIEFRKFKLPSSQQLNRIFYGEEQEHYYSYSSLQEFGQGILKPIAVLSFPYSFHYLPELSLPNKITIELGVNAFYGLVVDVRNTLNFKQDPWSGVRAAGGGGVGLGCLKLSISKGLAVGFVAIINFSLLELLLRFPIESLDEPFRNFLNNDLLRTPTFTTGSYLIYKSSEWMLNRLLVVSSDKEKIESKYQLSFLQKLSGEAFGLGDDILLAGTILTYTSAFGYSVFTTNPLLAMAIINGGATTLELIRYFSYTPHPFDNLQPKQSCFNTEKHADQEYEEDEESNTACMREKNIAVGITKRIGWKLLFTASTMYFGVINVCSDITWGSCVDDNYNYDKTWGLVMGAALLLEFGKNNLPSRDDIKSSWNAITTPISQFYGSMFKSVTGADTPLIPDNGLKAAAPAYGAINS